MARVAAVVGARPGSERATLAGGGVTPALAAAGGLALGFAATAGAFGPEAVTGAAPASTAAVGFGFGAAVFRLGALAGFTTGAGGGGGSATFSAVSTAGGGASAARSGRFWQADKPMPTSSNKGSSDVLRSGRKGMAAD